MGLLILASKLATDFQVVENLSLNRQGQTQVQMVSVSLSGKVFTDTFWGVPVKKHPVNAEFAQFTIV